MLMDLLVNFVLLGGYSVAALAIMWVLSKISFVRSTAVRFGRWFERMNDKLDNATGRYTTWR